MLLLRSWKWQTTVDCEMPSSPDTLWMLLTRVDFMVWSTALESMILGLPDHVWLSRFLKTEQNFLNQLVCVMWSTVPFTQQMFLAAWAMFSLWTCRGQIPKLDYVACSSVQLSNFTQNEPMHMSVHLPQYYQPKWVPSMAWTALVMWYTCCKLTCTKIL